jgi:hypothetical protein
MSMAIRPEDLPSDPARLIAMVLSLDAENDRLRAVIGTFKDMVFGSRSEKLAAVVANQLALDLADLATDVTLPAAANDDHVPSQAAGTIGKLGKKGPAQHWRAAQAFATLRASHRARDDGLSVLPRPPAQDRPGRQRGARRHSSDPCGCSA